MGQVVEYPADLSPDQRKKECIQGGYLKSKSMGNTQRAQVILSFPSQLKLARTQRGWSQARLAEELGLAFGMSGAARSLPLHDETGILGSQEEREAVSPHADGRSVE